VLSALGAVAASGIAAAVLADVVLKEAAVRTHAARLRRRVEAATASGSSSGESVDVSAASPASAPWWTRAPFGTSFEFGAIVGQSALWRRYTGLLEAAGLGDQNEALAQWSLLAASLVLFVGILTNAVLVSLVVVVALLVVAVVLAQGRADKRKRTMRAQLPDALDALAQALRAGLSFPQAVARVAGDAEEPIAHVLRALDTDVAVGFGISESFERFGQTSGLKELKMVATAVGVVARVGGNAPNMLEQTAAVIRQDLTLNRSLKAQTAQGRMSLRLVGSLPFVLVGLMSVLMPDYLHSWLGSGAGQFMLGLALGLLVIGFLWVRKVVTIDV
jgi:tight adherence protein B